MVRPEEFAVLHEIVKAARRTLSDGLWDYLIGGAESETTVKRNRQAIDSVALRPRVLRDVSGVDASTRLLGQPIRIPVVLAPIGSLQDLDPGGGATAARAAAEFGTISILSSACEPDLETVAEATDGPKVFQLYVRGDHEWVADHVRRAIAAGYRAFCFTIDLDYYSRRERDLAKRFVTTARRLASGEPHQARFKWDDVKRIRDAFDIPLVLKGIATAEDARLACDIGVDVVYVSNHGGRQLDHGRGTLAVLPEVVEEVRGECEIIVDGGFARGTDVVKAIALGATVVGIGRMAGFGLAAAGQAGLVRVLELLEGEITTCLGLLGVNRLDELGPAYLHPADPVVPPHVTSAFPLIEEGY